jgi:hypothetical protein
LLAAVALTGRKTERTFQGERKTTVDTLGVSFPFESSHLAYGQKETLPCGATVVAHAKIARVEGSVAMTANGSNVSGLPMPGALEVLKTFVDEAKFCFDKYTQERMRFGELRVCRLDLVRDFTGVSRIPELLEAFGHRPQRRRLVSNLFMDPRTGEAQTLAVRNKSVTARLYDKHVQSNGAATSGHLRFEVQFRHRSLQGAWARQNGGVVHVVNDLGSVNVDTLVRGMFERVGFDSEVASVDTFVKAVSNAPLSNAEKRSLLSHVLLPDLESAPTRRRNERLIRVHGIPQPSSTSVHPVRRRLDFDSGLEQCLESLDSASDLEEAMASLDSGSALQDVLDSVGAEVAASTASDGGTVNRQNALSKVGSGTHGAFLTNDAGAATNE